MGLWQRIIYVKQGDNMNKVLKMLVKETIHNNRLYHERDANGDNYTVFNNHGHEVLSVKDGWAKNHYSISIDKQPVLAVKWDQTDSKPLTPEQKDMIDIINVCKEKIDLQETAQAMTGRELKMANFLQHSLCKTAA